MQAIVNGIWGDTLGRHEKCLGIAMSIRDAQGRWVAPDRSFASAYPTAPARLVVLIHGLCETERRWDDPAAGRSLGSSIDDHDELTKVAVRYNSGLPIHESGNQLAALLESLTHDWPVPVESVALVGHSMGGLVARAAIVAADRNGHRWIQHLEDVITVASPHQGAPLERLAYATSWALGIASETRPLAEFLEGRSGGIKDLRYGAKDASLAPGIRHHFVAGAVTSDPQHPLGAAVGDLLVTTASAKGGRSTEPTSIVVVGGTNHFSVLDDPRVIDQVMAWLDPDPRGGLV
jgi:pimeloyl-ACP methyl ester carboxylesterase